MLEKKYHNMDIFNPDWTDGPFSCSFFSFKNAFHGRHGDSALLSDSKAIHKWGMSSSCWVGRLAVPYKGQQEKDIRREVDGLLNSLKNRVIAFVFEPILGEGGIIVPDEKGMRFLIKYLREKSMHSGSFHWTPVSVAAAIVNLNIIEESLVHLKEVGDDFIDCVREICNQHKDIITEVRGKGFMVGVEFKNSELRDEFIWKAKTENISAGLLLHSCGTRALRFYPRVNVSSDELDICLELFKNTFDFM